MIYYPEMNTPARAVLRPGGRLTVWSAVACAGGKLEAIAAPIQFPLRVFFFLL